VRIRIAIVIAILASSEVIAAQKTGDEFAELRQILGVPASTPVTKAKASALPAERPLKIYVSTAGDSDAMNHVTGLIRQISEKDAGKYGPAAAVLWISDANLILLHYEMPSKRLQEADAEMALDPRGGNVAHRITTEVDGYVIARSASGLIILDQYSRRVNLHAPRTELRDAFLKVLKAAAKGRQK
jgi:hypothetical protein